MNNEIFKMSEEIKKLSQDNELFEDLHKLKESLISIKVIDEIFYFSLDGFPVDAIPAFDLENRVKGTIRYLSTANANSINTPVILSNLIVCAIRTKILIKLWNLADEAKSYSLFEYAKLRNELIKKGGRKYNHSNEHNVLESQCIHATDDLVIIAINEIFMNGNNAVNYSYMVNAISTIKAMCNVDNEVVISNKHKMRHNGHKRNNHFKKELFRKIIRYSATITHDKNFHELYEKFDIRRNKVMRGPMNMFKFFRHNEVLDISPKLWIKDARALRKDAILAYDIDQDKLRSIKHDALLLCNRFNKCSDIMWAMFVSINGRTMFDAMDILNVMYKYGYVRECAISKIYAPA